MLKEFKEFAMKGNVVDMAIGVIIGGAFGKIVASLVNDVLMPPLGLLVGNMDFSDLSLVLKAPLDQSKPITINYGLFINNVVNFIIVAFTIFVVIRTVNRFNKKEEAPAAPTTKTCSYCLSTIPLKATRCASCTASLNA